MSTFLKQALSLISGQMAGSNNKAKFVVKTLRATYILSAGGIAVAWYSAYRNERVEPHTGKFPIPFISKLKRQFPADRPESEFEHADIGGESSGAASNAGGLKGTLPELGNEYVFPFTNKATWGRIDQGVDFGGTGPIFTPGDAKVISVGAVGWPGGGGVVLQLLNGPRANHYIYIFEGIQVTVRKDQILTAGQIVGSFIPFSPTGIEIGFCDANGVPISHGEYTEGKVTRGGKEMAAFLHQIKFNKKQQHNSRVIHYSPSYLHALAK
jgi:murein DD-endopeptidase MepM/ murein hydrolase activator NlpD